jgi:hypothetical protein
MKPNEPSRTALNIARQRAAHQVLDHGSILYDPFAMKILREDEKDVLQFAKEYPSASIGRLFTTARSRIAEDALSGAVEGGIRQIVILGAGLDTFALRNPHGARQILIYEVDHPATQAWKRQRLAEAQNRKLPNEKISLIELQKRLIPSGMSWIRNMVNTVDSNRQLAGALHYDPDAYWCPHCWKFTKDCQHLVPPLTTRARSCRALVDSRFTI